jgi:hypothetical protein
VEGRVNKRFHRFGEINHNNNHHHGQGLDVDAQVDIRARNGESLGPIGKSVKVCLCFPPLSPGSGDTQTERVWLTRSESR